MGGIREESHMARSGILVLMLEELAGSLQDPAWPVLSRDYLLI